MNISRLVCFADGNGLGLGGGADEAKFTQEDLNKVLAEDRRKHQAQLVKVQQTLEETMQSKNLSVQEKEQMAAQLEEIQAQGRTREQQLAHEKKQAEENASKKVTEASKESQKWRERFTQQLIESRLSEAVSDGDIFNPGQLKQLLKSGVELEQVRDEQGRLSDVQEVFVRFEDRDAAGEPIQSKMLPVAAVKRMKQLSAVYGNQFRAGVVSGVGSGNGGGSAAGHGIDVAKLSTEQYMRLRKENKGKPLDPRKPIGR